ncbi:hypothetical protein D3C76_1082200 [compost metagenome]
MASEPGRLRTHPTVGIFRFAAEQPGGILMVGGGLDEVSVSVGHLRTIHQAPGGDAVQL